VTNPVNTNQVIPVLTTSPNSVQPLPQTQFKPAVGKDGKAYNYNPMTGTYGPALIEGTTDQFEADPKSNAHGRDAGGDGGSAGGGAGGVGGIPQWTLWWRGAGDECADSDARGDARGDADGDSYAGDGGDECSGAGGGANVVDAGGGEGCLPGGTNQ
jgi:hypothetical protein